MRALIDAVREIVMVLTGRVTMNHDPLISDLHQYATDARKEAAASRQRQEQLNIVEREYLRGGEVRRDRS